MDGLTRISPYLVKSTDTAYATLGDQVGYFYVKPIGGITASDLNSNVTFYLDFIKSETFTDYDAQYSYDADGNLTQEKIYTTTSPAVLVKQVDYAYNNDNTKIATETFTYGSNVFVKTYFYNSNGYVTNIQVRKQ